MGSYNSISLRKLYITASVFCVTYIILAILAYILSGTVFGAFAGEAFREAHPEMMISGKCRLLLCLAEIVWLPFIAYIISCTGWAFSAKRCRRTLKAAPALWILGFTAEHVLALLISRSSMKSYASEGWLIQRTEYITFFFSIFLVGALVLVCTAAALGIDEDRHVKHLKYK
ncbi:MAG: hypothetical protein J5724_02410 [Ruminococcus sp.]|uniref:hypothetical protein n=1 Tax=Ruminococcus sp. TaxID=41978 RepID=UPI001B745478|nr:hypothetical protein [Ruminococcus sp.]MBO4493218.1 hypothetical protein [Ruminococcus sp.]MBP5431731.1 hypothetical protein [Ruminococcus sp.]